VKPPHCKVCGADEYGHVCAGRPVFDDDWSSSTGKSSRKSAPKPLPFADEAPKRKAPPVAEPAVRKERPAAREVLPQPKDNADILRAPPQSTQKRDRREYQRELMRKRRAEAKEARKGQKP
jgi:hypothetical protein